MLWITTLQSRSKHAPMRLRAARKLDQVARGSRAAQRAVSALSVLLHDEDASVRREAALAIVKIRWAPYWGESSIADHERVLIAQSVSALINGGELSSDLVSVLECLLKPDPTQFTLASDLEQNSKIIGRYEWLYKQLIEMCQSARSVRFLLAALQSAFSVGIGEPVSCSREHIGTRPGEESCEDRKTTWTRHFEYNVYIETRTYAAKFPFAELARDRLVALLPSLGEDRAAAEEIDASLRGFDGRARNATTSTAQPYEEERE